MLAFLLKSNQAPSPEHIEAAAKLIQSLALVPATLVPTEAEGAAPDPSAGAPVGPQGPPSGQLENWNVGVDRITKRTDEPGG